MSKSAECIYCGELFDPTAGEGDHVLSAQLFGLFEGEKRFRGLCKACNNKIGRLEQGAIRGSHLGFYRFLVRPKPGRPNKSGCLIPRGISRATQPKFTVESDGRTQLIELNDEHPECGVLVDQLELYDDKGNHDQVRLYSGMGVERLRSEIQSSRVKHPTTWIVNSSQSLSAEFLSLVSQVLTASKTEELEGVDPGIYEGYTSAVFSVTKDFFRVLAKIAFHYYLVHNPRSFKGDESGFEHLRRFILDGTGDVEELFKTSGPQFQTPFVRTPSGAFCPKFWCHILAAAEEKGSIVAYLQFYLGPGSIPDPHYITLGRSDSRLVLPNPAFGHVYEVEQDRSDNYKYAGKVYELSMTRLS